MYPPGVQINMNLAGLSEKGSSAVFAIYIFRKEQIWHF